MAKQVGLFFGSFNPIHVGHLIIGKHMVVEGGLDEVWFVISPQNPFKQKATLLDERQRLYMANLAVEDDYDLRASNVEFHLPRPSYTVDTLAFLDEKYPDVAFTLLMGSDNLVSLPRWKNHEILLERYRILVYPRPGSPEPELAAHPRVRLLEVPQILLSASYIRKRIAAGKSIRYLVTEPVRRYIDELALYRSDG